MTVKLIACDLDGTLLNENNQISERTQAAIKAAQAQGVMFCLATGRMFCSARRFAEQLQLSSPIISYNGALIKEHSTGNILRSLPLDLAVAEQVLLHCQKHGLYVQKYVNDCLYVKELTGYAERYAQKVNVPVFAEGEAFCQLVQAPDKLMLVVEPSEQPLLLEQLNKAFGQHVFITTSNDRFIEIIRPEVNKGDALKYLGGHFGVDRQEMMALGDSFNDSEMLEYAGLGIAMANAAAPLKQLCQDVTASNNDDGVALAIEKHVLAQ